MVEVCFIGGGNQSTQGENQGPAARHRETLTPNAYLLTSGNC